VTCARGACARGVPVCRGARVRAAHSRGELWCVRRVRGGPFGDCTCERARVRSGGGGGAGKAAAEVVSALLVAHAAGRKWVPPRARAWPRGAHFAGCVCLQDRWCRRV
jgi:hypothetical protein